MSFALLESLLVALLIGGSVLFVARNAWLGIRAAGDKNASGCGGCNACGGCPTARE